MTRVMVITAKHLLHRARVTRLKLRLKFRTTYGDMIEV